MGPVSGSICPLFFELAQFVLAFNALRRLILLKLLHGAIVADAVLDCKNFKLFRKRIFYMKNSKLKIAQLAVMAAFLAILGAGCNGGSTSQLVVVTNPTPTPTATATIGPIHVCPAWGCGPTPIHTFSPIPIASFGPNPTPTICPAWGCDGPEPIYPIGVVTDSTDSDTRDTDLQQANLQSATLASRAQAIANQFQMSVSAATQLAVLGDKVQAMTAQGQDLTDEDRDAITQSALNIAGLTSDEVNDAFQKSVAGDNSAADALVEKAAQNLGMPSSDNLRGQLLQALGVQLQ